VNSELGTLRQAAFSGVSGQGFKARKSFECICWK
jgi:hypothetical protein